MIKKTFENLLLNYKDKNKNLNDKIFLIRIVAISAVRQIGFCKSVNIDKLFLGTEENEMK